MECFFGVRGTMKHPLRNINKSILNQEHFVFGKLHTFLTHKKAKSNHVN